MKNFLLFPLFYCFLLLRGYAAGFDIKTSSIIDQPAIEVLGDYNGSWYVIGFEKPNHPEKPARFYILKYAAGFPIAKSSPVYQPFGEKTDYLKAAIVDKKLCIFYSRTEHLPDRPNMVDGRDGYKQIPKILRQDYDPVTLLPAGEPVVVFDEAKEHFAASGIDIAQSEDQSKTAIVIKHYFRQSKFKVLLLDNITDAVFEHRYTLKTDKDLVNFKRIVVSNTGQVFLEARIQEDPLHPDTKDKRAHRFYFFSINKTNTDDEAPMLMLPSTNPGHDALINNDPLIACLNNGQLVVAFDHYMNERSSVLKNISIKGYLPDFTPTASQEIIPDVKFTSKAASYQNNRAQGLEYVEGRQIIPLDGGNFMLIAECRHSTDSKDKVTGLSTTLFERHYLLAYRLDESMTIKAADFIDKHQSAHNIYSAFSAQASRLGNDVFLFYNEDCAADDEHGLYLLGTKLLANGTESTTQKIVHTSEDFFVSLNHIYVSSTGRILFTEEKIVDFDVEGRQLKLLEIKPK